jgi:acyl-CoA thioesterase-1
LLKPVRISSSSHLLFIGDSVTDCGRREKPFSLGSGYVSIIAGRFAKLYPKLRITNRGISGNTSGDLVARWKADCLDLRPTIVSIMIGINDTWRRYDQGSETAIAAFEENYRSILDRTAAGLDASLVLNEPFLLPLCDDQKLWHIDLDPKRRLIRGLANEYGAIFVPLQETFQKAAKAGNACEFVVDGVHPTDLGHKLIADTWMKAVGLEEAEENGPEGIFTEFLIET